MKEILLISILATTLLQCESGVLYPRPNSVRELHSLDGLWQFSLSSTVATKFEDTKWSMYNLEDDDEDVELMPVPSSYNDISTNEKVRDYVGVVRYHRNFVIPSSWAQKKIWLRFGSVCYAAQVYINGKFAMSHEVGHLPFGDEITSLVKLDDVNNITVLVNNVLTSSTIPQGSTQTLPSGRIKQTYNFDFFNYAGIDRPVVLYTTEETYIDDIKLSTELLAPTAIVRYNITIVGSYYNYTIEILDKEGRQVSLSRQQTATTGILIITNASLWWPYLMSDQPGYLYRFKVDVFDRSNTLLDRYEQPFGVRELTWDHTTFKINGKPIYLRGFGRHEDSDFRGKGLDLPLVIKDHNLIKWTGANSYRTSHYPYAEEIMDLADSLGIMIIDEAPAIELTGFGKAVLGNHSKAMTELYNRDKNRPSVIMWSLANQPHSYQNLAGSYFSQLTGLVRSLDLTRPITVVNNLSPDEDQSGQYLDILSINRYNGWYDNAGDLDTIIPSLIEQAEEWHTKHNKPVLVTEYGADTLEGYHTVPTFIWSEEYQTDLMSNHFQAFDEMRNKGWFIGEMIWNFADFKTEQAFLKVGGNKKGIFTRQRHPKTSAHLIRRRYWGLARLLNNATLPLDLDNYIIEEPGRIRDEF